MLDFAPKRVFYEPEALNYPLGKDLVELFRNQEIEVKSTTSHNRVTGIPGSSEAESYREAKRTLVIGVRRSQTFQTCKPSAHYQLPLVTSCPGMCEYCYLATNLGSKPYLRIYVNIEEILSTAKKLIDLRLPEITIFEGAATSDPIPVEKYTGSLKKAIEFFGQESHGFFRFVTKFNQIDSLLAAKHFNHTRFRFSINCNSAVQNYEHGTPAPLERIHAASKVMKAGYPIGFIVAPIFRFEHWQEEYETLFKQLAHELTAYNSFYTFENISFEFISHRFTTKAKNNILKVFPKTILPMEEIERKFKYGQFGYGKYIYLPDEMKELKTFFTHLTQNYFPEAKIEYFV